MVGVHLPSDVFLRGKKELFKHLRPGNALTPEIERMLIDIYRSRGKRALETIKKGGVIKRGQRWFVRGRVGEYEVVKTYCSCRDYVLNIVTDKADVDLCYHGLAKTVCEGLGAYYVVEPAAQN